MTIKDDKEMVFLKKENLECLDIILRLNRDLLRKMQHWAIRLRIETPTLRI